MVDVSPIAVKTQNEEPIICGSEAGSKKERMPELAFIFTLNTLTLCSHWKAKTSIEKTK